MTHDTKGSLVKPWGYFTNGTVIGVLPSCINSSFHACDHKRLQHSMRLSENLIDFTIFLRLKLLLLIQFWLYCLLSPSPEEAAAAWIEIQVIYLSDLIPLNLPTKSYTQGHHKSIHPGALPWQGSGQSCSCRGAHRLVWSIFWGRIKSSKLRSWGWNTIIQACERLGCRIDYLATHDYDGHVDNVMEKLENLYNRWGPIKHVNGCWNPWIMYCYVKCGGIVAFNLSHKIISQSEAKILSWENIEDKASARFLFRYRYTWYLNI